MATLSKNAKRLARTRRRNTLLERQTRTIATKANRDYAVLLAILAQNGGQIIVDPKTFAHVMSNLAKIGYQILPGKEGTENEGKTLVVLVTSEPAEEVPAPPAPTVVDPSTPSLEQESV